MQRGRRNSDGFVHSAAACEAIRQGFVEAEQFLCQMQRGEPHPCLAEPLYRAVDLPADGLVTRTRSDADGRRQLIALYSQGLDLRATNLPDVIERSAGASPAFIRELLRRAALLAVDSANGDLVVGDSELAGALEELTSGAGPLTGTLLGMQPSSAPGR